MSMIFEVLFPMPTARKVPAAWSSLSDAAKNAFCEATSFLNVWKSDLSTKPLVFVAPATTGAALVVAAAGALVP
jgi:hypothetical protein